MCRSQCISATINMFNGIVKCCCTVYHILIHHIYILCRHTVNSISEWMCICKRCSSSNIRRSITYGLLFISRYSNSNFCQWIFIYRLFYKSCIMLSSKIKFQSCIIILMSCIYIPWCTVSYPLCYKVVYRIQSIHCIIITCK